MIYDHENPLTEEELEILGNKDFDSFLEYIDSQAEHLKQFTKPLSSYHTKRFASISAATQGRELTKEELKKADTIGKENEAKAIDRIANKKWKEKEIEMLKKTGVKNVKTNRSQWFD
jgi:hypothetical protein|tara:strand:- start:1030 stop:1380 length:351 start_codon:yes stop_codon:yes gene_type:complete